jgi:radical SAM protein with 4Fe4S-binding SPASM domain
MKPTESEKEAFRKWEEFPETIGLEITNECTANCPFCPRSKMTRPVGVMDFGLFKRIVDQGFEGGTETFVLHWFGETTLVPGWLDYFKYIRGKDPNFTKRIVMYTNGTGLNNPDELLELRPATIAFHIEGVDEETHKATQPGTDWKTVTNNFFKLVDAKNGNEKFKDVFIQAHFTVGKFPLENGMMLDTGPLMNEYRKIFHVEGVNDTGGVSYMPWFNEMTPSEYCSDPLRVWPIERRGPCMYLWSALTVTWEGKVTMCCKDINLEYKGLGNLVESTIAEVWHSFERRYLRYLHLSRQIDDLPCATCYFPYFNQHGEYPWKSFMKEFWN